MSDNCWKCAQAKVGGTPCDMHAAALPPVRSEPMFSISRFRSVLVKHGIIGRDAIDDAANYDGGRTLAATRAAYDELVENTALTGGVLAVPSNGVVGG